MKKPDKSKINPKAEKVLRCVQCGQVITEDDLKDVVFKEEHSLSGLCPACQDDLTAILDEE